MTFLVKEGAGTVAAIRNFGSGRQFNFGSLAFGSGSATLALEFGSMNPFQRKSLTLQILSVNQNKILHIVTQTF